MLTLDEIKTISFRKAKFNGYNPEDVDSFIDEVIETVERDQKEKAELLRKLEILASKIEQYRADEETVRNALLSTQKLSDSTIKDAHKKADAIISDAQSKASAMILDAQRKVENEKKRYVSIEAETSQLRKEIVLLYKKHLKLVDEMPTDADVKQKKAELDKKYPVNAEAVTTAAFDSDEDIKIAPQKKLEPAKTQEVNIEELKHHSKFDSLKFGDNYDVEEE